MAVLIGIVVAAPATMTHADEKTSVAHVRILVEPMSDPKIVKVVTPDSPEAGNGRYKQKESH